VTPLYHSIIGLSGSGKTTYLAAFWHLICSGEISTKLVLDRLVGHLNKIVEAWRRCERVPHTPIAAEANVSIHVHEPQTERKAVLAFPDLSGESFELQFANRTCTRSYLRGFESDGGILLFVTADRAVEGLTIIELDSTLHEADTDSADTQVIDWRSDFVPEQVRLVDLLQFLQREPFRVAKRRISVIVSAWDVLPRPTPSPQDWLSRELPLLHQFLLSNRSAFEFRVYGVSAQGGNVDGDERIKLLTHTPSERIQCVGPECDAHDLTTPVVWLMSEA